MWHEFISEKKLEQHNQVGLMWFSSNCPVLLDDKMHVYYPAVKKTQIKTHLKKTQTNRDTWVCCGSSPPGSQQNFSSAEFKSHVWLLKKRNPGLWSVLPLPLVEICQKRCHWVCTKFMCQFVCWAGCSSQWKAAFFPMQLSLHLWLWPSTRATERGKWRFLKPTVCLCL